MTYSGNKIIFYTDTLIVNTILQNNLSIEKTAADGMVSSLIQKVKDYVGNHIDPNDKSGSLFNILGPGAITVAFSAMGLGWLGALTGLAMRVFNVDVKGIIESIWNKLKGLISGDKLTTSDQIESIVQGSVQEHYQPATASDADKAAKMMESKTAINLMKDAKIVRLAMIEYEKVYIYKTASREDFLSMFSGRKVKTVSILTRVLSWIFKIALASAGLMVAGDVINKFVGRPNALDNTIQQGKPVEQTSTISSPIATQTKFPINKNYHHENKNIGDDNWIENITNNQSSISNMLVNFAKEVYDGLNGKESLIITSSGFPIIRDRIVWYNRTSPNAPFIVIPRYFRSKKQIVDYFIDEVAEK